MRVRKQDFPKYGVGKQSIVIVAGQAKTSQKL
jgi:hypothetical protein